MTRSAPGEAGARRRGRRVPCAGCAYDLVGVHRDGACPECGLPVSATLGAAPLRHAPAESLRRVRDATGWLAAGLAVAAAASPVTWVPVLISEWSTHPRATVDMWVLGLGAAFAAASVPLAIGLWRLGTSMGTLDRTFRDRTRGSVRLVAVLAGAAPAVIAVSAAALLIDGATRDASGRTWMGWRDDLAGAMLVAGSLQGLLAVLAFGTGFQHAAAIASGLGLGKTRARLSAMSVAAPLAILLGGCTLLGLPIVAGIGAVLARRLRRELGEILFKGPAAALKP